MNALQVVLHIEDDDSLQLLFGRIFKNEGFGYHPFATVDQAMAYLQHQPPFENPAQFPPPTLVVTDLGLGSKQNPVEFIRWFRRLPEHQHTPVVVLTGGADREMEEKVMKAGASAFVMKGIGMRETLQQIRAALLVASMR